MPVIKSNNAPINLAPFSMKDIEAQARAILMRAQQQAEQLLAEAQAAAEALKQEQKALGLAEGKQAGLAAGKEEGRKTAHQQALNEHKQQFTQTITALSAAAKDLNQSRKQLEAGAMAEVVKLAVSIARRVTKRYGELDPNVLTANVAEAMKLVVRSTDVRIAVNPSQQKTLTGVLPQLKLQWPALEHVAIVEDATISSGGCRIYAGAGQVDAALDTQIDRIAGELLPSFVAPPLAAGVPEHAHPPQAAGLKNSKEIG